jgi:enoyl-CoA hydratase/carnithine racemase
VPEGRVAAAAGGALVDEVEGIRAETVDAVLWVTIDRPEVGNALSPANRRHLVELLSAAEEDIAVRCVVLTGTGKSFCTGADLSASAKPPPRPPDVPVKIAGDVGRNLRKDAQRLISTVFELEKPVVAAVNGTAAGLGFHLAPVTSSSPRTPRGSSRCSSAAAWSPTPAARTSSRASSACSARRS